MQSHGMIARVHRKNETIVWYNLSQYRTSPAPAPAPAPPGPTHAPSTTPPSTPIFDSKRDLKTTLIVIGITLAVVVLLVIPAMCVFFSKEVKKATRSSGQPGSYYVSPDDDAQ